MSKITTHDFYKFLCKENAIGNYIDNCLKDCGEKSYVKATGIYNKRAALEFFLAQYPSITCAFVWASTPEGYSFWDTLSNKWFKEQKRLNLKRK